MTGRENPQQQPLPVGKLPPDLLQKIIGRAPTGDPRLVVKPGIGIDCAVLDFGFTLLVFKTDPITFAADEIGWYLVQVNANDLATTGATPRWLLLTSMLPEGRTTTDMVERISGQVFDACRALDITVIGGHTEITAGLKQPILVGTLIGEVERSRLITPYGIRPGNRLLLTKGVPIEAVSILARERPDGLKGTLTAGEIEAARRYLIEPGIGVTRDARIAIHAGQVNAMHDPTEGGLASALWEMAEAGKVKLRIATESIPIPDLARQVCAAFGIDPLAAIASGALLLAVESGDADMILAALRNAGILCAEIGSVEAGPISVWAGESLLPRPARDEIARVFESST